MKLLAAALATFFGLIQFYASLEVLSPTPQVGFSFVGRTGALVLIAVLGCAALVAGAALVRDRDGFERTPLLAIIFAWIGATLASAILGFDPLSGLQVVAMMTFAGLFALALVRYYREPGVARIVVVTYLATGTLAALTGIGMVLAHAPHALYALTNGRAAGFFVAANQFAEFLDLFIFVALGAALGARSPGVRVLAGSGVVVGTLALALTFSREGWVGAAAAATFLAFLVWGRRGGVALALATVVALAVSLTRPFPHHDPSDSFSRLRTLAGGLRVAELFPLTGVGPVNFWRVYPAIRVVNGPAAGTFGALHPHDLYLSLAGELGLVGLGAVGYGWYRFARAMHAALRARPGRERWFPLGICAALIALFAVGIFDAIGVVQMTFVWIPYAALALAAADGAEL